MFYDDNEISIDGRVDSWFTDDTKKRFESYGWEVFGNVDGHDVSKINSCIEKAKKICKAYIDLLQNRHREGFSK